MEIALESDGAIQSYRRLKIVSKHKQAAIPSTNNDYVSLLIKVIPITCALPEDVRECLLYN